MLQLNHRAIGIHQLAKDPDKLYKEFSSPTSKYIRAPWVLKEAVMYIPSDIVKDKKFHRALGIALVNVLQREIINNIYTYLRYDSVINLINFCNKIIDTKAKNDVIDIILNNSGKFKSNTKKRVAKIAVNFLEQDHDRSINILRTFHRTISVSDFNNLMKKIKNGLDNKDVKQILSKSRLYDYLKYDEETVNNNYDEKVKLIKAIAKTPTLIKRLPFILYVDLKHLKEIAPAMRFKLIQFIFKYECKYTKYGWNYGDSLLWKVERSKSKVKEDKVVVSKISVKEMKELLFSVCLQKNDEFTKWIKNYAIYIACMNSTKRVHPRDIKI